MENASAMLTLDKEEVELLLKWYRLAGNATYMKSTDITLHKKLQTSATATVESSQK